MGIRLQCPNGHALHVKESLAGKRGVCPKCSVAFEIPSASTEEEAAASPADCGAATSLEEVTASTPKPAVQSSVVDHSAARPTEQSETSPQETTPTAAAPVATPARKIASPAKAIPHRPATDTPPAAEIAIEATDHEWYVRPAGGEQHGPVSGDVFREWIANHQVAADSYVWRSGWADWRLAAEASAELPAPLPITAPQLSPSQSVAETSQAATRYRKRQQRLGQRQLLIAILLLLLTVGLGVVLWWVLSQQTAPTDEFAQHSRAGFATMIDGSIS